MTAITADRSPGRPAPQLRAAAREVGARRTSRPVALDELHLRTVLPLLVLAFFWLTSVTIVSIASRCRGATRSASGASAPTSPS